MEATNPRTTAIESGARSTTSSVRGAVALAAAVCLSAIVIGALVSGFGTRAQTSPIGVDTSYDQIESMRGAAITLSAPVDTSYDQIESRRGALTLPGPVDTSYDQIESMRGAALQGR
jgi:hypothetical protein